MGYEDTINNSEIFSDSSNDEYIEISHSHVDDTNNIQNFDIDEVIRLSDDSNDSDDIIEVLQKQTLINN
jgi:hypothetical protein